MMVWWYVPQKAKRLKVTLNPTLYNQRFRAQGLGFEVPEEKKGIDSYFIMVPFKLQVPKKVKKYGTPKPRSSGFSISRTPDVDPPSVPRRLWEPAMLRSVPYPNFQAQNSPKA